MAILFAVWLTGALVFGWWGWLANEWCLETGLGFLDFILISAIWPVALGLETTKKLRGH
jgi:hypothetical protein